jgi:hypothetical protein
VFGNVRYELKKDGPMHWMADGSAEQELAVADVSVGS